MSDPGNGKRLFKSLFPRRWKPQGARHREDYLLGGHGMVTVGGKPKGTDRAGRGRGALGSLAAVGERAHAHGVGSFASPWVEWPTSRHAFQVDLLLHEEMALLFQVGATVSAQVTLCGQGNLLGVVGAGWGAHIFFFRSRDLPPPLA